MSKQPSRFGASKTRSRLRTGKLWPRLASRLSREGRALIAVSGGVDSLAMLFLVLPPDRRDLARLIVEYVHHGTGRYADKAEKHVQEVAGKLGLEFRVDRVTIDPEKVKSDGFESTARRARYLELDRRAKAENCKLILTGHTLDDRAEGVLLFLMRGSGAGGLSGAREHRGKYFRPLTNFSHDELTEFLRTTGVSAIEDPSNRDLRYGRNRVRHLVRPMIAKQFGLGAWKNLARSAERLASTEELLESEAESALSRTALRRTSRWILLDTAALRLYLQELRVRVLRRAWRHAIGDNSLQFSLPRSDIRRLLGLLRGKPGYVTRLEGGVTARFTVRGLVLDGTAGEEEIAWKLPGRLDLPDGTRLEAKRSTKADFPGISPEPGRVEYVDADAFGDNITIRPWREGDRFVPLGRPGGEVKVARALSGGSVFSRGPLWVAEKDGIILYVIGYRIAHHCRVRSGSSSLWRLICTFPEDMAGVQNE